MSKIIQLVSEYESLVFPTRTFLKEVAYWGSLLVASIVYMINILDASTAKCLDKTCFIQDIVRNKEYAIAAIAFLIKHIAYTVDTYLLLKRKVAQPVDFATNLNHIIFWIIMVIFALSFTSLECNNNNIFKCGGTFSNGAFTYRFSSRWPLIWIAALFKLIVDLGLFIYFHIVQKRRLSVAHGQAVSVLVLDLQYFLSCLHFNDHWAAVKFNPDYYYDAKVLFLVIFIVGFVGLGFAVVCIILGINEWKGTNSGGVKNTKRSMFLFMIAAFWIISFVYMFVFDGTAGCTKATYKTVLFLMTLVLFLIGAVYGIFNILAKRNLEFTGYDVNSSVSRSQAA